MQIEREDTYLRFIRWSHHSQRRLAGEKKKKEEEKEKKKKYPIDRYNNLSKYMNTNGDARSKELVNRATVRRKHPVHSCRNRTRATGRKRKETKAGRWKKEKARAR